MISKFIKRLIYMYFDPGHCGRNISPDLFPRLGGRLLFLLLGYVHNIMAEVFLEK